MPFFLRQEHAGAAGDFETFFDRVAHRARQLILYDEAGATNPSYLGDRLESESHQRFRLDHGSRAASVDLQIELFFSPATMRAEAKVLAYEDLEVKRAREALQTVAASIRKEPPSMHVFGIPSHPKYVGAERRINDIEKQRAQVYLREAFLNRLTALEALLRVLPADPKGKTAIESFMRDLRRYLAEAGIMLDILEEKLLIQPIEEALLQREVIEKLLPRLAAQHPDLERDFVKAYHDLLKGVDENTVFGNAFKALEELARRLAKDRKLMLNKEDRVKKCFPGLHPTTIKTIANLANHRGDKGGHGRKGPAAQEIRYLLFSICNIALLLLDHP